MKLFAYFLPLMTVASVAIGVPIIGGMPTSTYGGVSPGRLWLEAAAAVALAVCSLMRIGTARGVFLGVVGASWLVPELAGWLAGPAPLAAIADAWSRVLVAMAVVAFVPRIRSRSWVRALAAATLAAGALGAVSRVLLVDPFLDIRCWRRCDTNPLSIADGPLGPVLDHVSSLVVAGSAVAFGWLGVLGRRRGPEHGVAAMSLPTAALVAGSVGPGVLRLTSTESAVPTPFVSVWLLAQLGAIAIAVATVRDRVLQWRLRVRLLRLAGAFEYAPEAFASALRVGVRDPSLEVRYWAASRARYVDCEGSEVDQPRPDRDCHVTYVARRGEPVAAIVHQHSVDGRRLDHALGAGLRLTLENEQLRAAALAELQALNHSRTRVVERATLERHRLERNLHDGAQQRVVSLALITRMLAQRVARGESQDTFATVLTHRAEALTWATVEELRRVAHGIYPAVLADTGLAGAIMELTESSSDVAVRMCHIPQRRYPGIVESTAYVVIETALADARDRGAATLDLCGHEADGVLTYELVDDATSAPGTSVTNLADHVGALSGTLQVLPHREANRVCLELPCGS